MKTILLTGIFILFGIFAYSQSAVGVWRTIDDETGKAKSHVEIYENDQGKLEGKVIKILTPGKEDEKCTECSGQKKDQPINGMIVLWNLEKNGKSAWKNGKILDPNNGKEYKSKMTLKDENTLEVRGYIGFSLIGRTQTWHRVK